MFTIYKSEKNSKIIKKKCRLIKDIYLIVILILMQPLHNIFKDRSEACRREGESWCKNNLIISKNINLILLN